MTVHATVLIDTREQRPLILKAYPIKVDTLPVGDYGIQGFSDWTNPEFIVERKSLNDLIQSMIGQRRKPFFAELCKMRQFRFAGLLVESTREHVAAQAYRSNATPESMLSSLDVIQVQIGIHVIWAGDAEMAARRLEGMVRAFVGGRVKDYHRLTNEEANEPQ